MFAIARQAARGGDGDAQALRGARGSGRGRRRVRLRRHHRVHGRRWSRSSPAGAAQRTLLVAFFTGHAADTGTVQRVHAARLAKRAAVDAALIAAARGRDRRRGACAALRMANVAGAAPARGARRSRPTRPTSSPQLPQRAARCRLRARPAPAASDRRHQQEDHRRRGRRRRDRGPPALGGRCNASHALDHRIWRHAARAKRRRNRRGLAARCAVNTCNPANTRLPGFYRLDLAERRRRTPRWPTSTWRSWPRSTPARYRSTSPTA